MFDVVYSVMLQSKIDQWTRMELVGINTALQYESFMFLRGDDAPFEMLEHFCQIARKSLFGKESSFIFKFITCLLLIFAFILWVMFSSGRLT